MPKMAIPSLSPFSNGTHHFPPCVTIASAPRPRFFLPPGCRPGFQSLRQSSHTSLCISWACNRARESVFLKGPQKILAGSLGSLRLIISTEGRGCQWETSSLLNLCPQIQVPALPQRRTPQLSPTTGSSWVWSPLPGCELP